MLRHRMNILIRLLEAGRDTAILDLIASPKYRKALLALESAGCVKLIKAHGGDIVSVFLLDSYAGYHLNRHDVWVNRIGGFIFGLISGILVTAFGGLLLAYARVKLGI